MAYQISLLNLPYVVTVIFVLLGLGSSGQGFKQELYLYLKGGNALYFEDNVANLSAYREYLPLVERGCGIGVWRTFEDVNYTSHASSWGYVNSQTFQCANVTATSWSSLRHWALNDTAKDAISLYSDTYQAGEEILVTGQSYGGITIPIKSFSSTGLSGWTIYEGQSLDGKSACIQVLSANGYNFNWAYTLDELEMSTIGSVIRGCDERTPIYKNSHPL